jgi:hypothetical protein
MTSYCYCLTVGIDSGHYGQTDPHFRYNFGRRPQHRIVQLDKVYMCALKSPLDDSWQRLLPKLDRDLEPNKNLIKKKMAKKIPWNHTVIRFRWHEDSCVEAPGAAGGGGVHPISSLSQPYPEVRAQVADVMRQAIRPESAFFVRSWAKDPVNRACSAAASASLDPDEPCNSIGCS